MSLRFAVVCEADADFRVATELADRVLVESIDWLDDSSVASQREWIASSRGGRWLTWTSIKQLAREAGVRAHGHFNGEPGSPDATAARRALEFLWKEFPDLNAVILIRDQDDQEERRAGLEQGRNQETNGIPIVVGLAIVERESWAITGFEPQDAKEILLLDGLRQELGGDPRMCSQQLTACKDDQARRSPKRVLRQLCADDRQRERQCWQVTPLNTLRDRGAENGLVDYLHEVRTRLAPLIGHVPHDRDPKST